MPTNKKNLRREKRKIITDIIFENIIPMTNSDIYWGLDMLTGAIREKNIDKEIRITKYDVKNVVTKLSNNRDDISLHLIEGDIYIRFM